LLCVLVAGGAVPAAEVAEPSFGHLYPSISITSDYRYNGVSNSDGAVLQASLHWIGARNYYAGVWASGVDFDDPGNTSYELDLYAGREFDIDATSVRVEALYTAFPDKSFTGPTYDFLQLKIGARRSFGAMTVGAQGAWVPAASYDSGVAWRSSVEAEYAINRWLMARAHVGRRWIERGFDRSYWEAGAIATWSRFSLELRYVDTNLSPRECGFSDRCDPAIVGTLTLRFW
jgi:uncharacterized protein (TIGR02001 family)